MNIAVLDTGLFPDVESVESAITHLLPVYNVYRYDLRQADRREREWDQLLDELLASDRILCV